MILNEKVEDFFNSKEMETIERMKSVQDNYSNLDNPINNDMDGILEFTIKGEEGIDDSKLSGVLDYTNSQFVIKKLGLNSEITNKVDVIKKLLNSLIVNLESNYSDISTIYWRLNKVNSECLKAALDMHFVIEESNQYVFELTYYLSSVPYRKSYNTHLVTHTANMMANSTGIRSV